MSYLQVITRSNVSVNQIRENNITFFNSIINRGMLHDNLEIGILLSSEGYYQDEKM